MIGQISTGIIHEINNPLSYIDINIDTLESMLDEVKSGDSEVMNELHDIVDDLKQGIGSIKGIADGLKRFTCRSWSTDFEDFQLNEEINTILKICRNEYKSHAELDFQPGDIEPIRGDAGRIKQVLLNLIINASHAIKDKDDLNMGMISVRTRQVDGHVVCEVADTGTGIPEHICDKVFESFFTTKVNGKGTGLGLSLSKRIIEEEHRGQLTFVSEADKGTTFIIKLPTKRQKRLGSTRV